MQSTVPANAVTNPDIDARALTKALAGYRTPSLARSIVEIVMTAAPLALAWLAMWTALYFGQVWLCLLLAIPTAGFLVRLFMIQHDCGHGAFFHTRRTNDWVGRVIGVFTLTPYDYWRRTHAAHHSSSGNLDRRGMGDLDILTVNEYLALPLWSRWRYRIYRNPLVLFGLAPAFLFLLQNRLPIGLMVRAGWTPWISTMATNAAIAVLVGGAIWLLGIVPFLLLHLPVTLLAASIGVWLFYVQHQFEQTSWDPDKDWDMHEAALHGSSHYDLPGVLRWFTANIGIHHIHHLASRIPYYRLPQVLRDHPELTQVGRLTLFKSLGCVRLVLWDEGKKRLISFREVRRGLRVAPQASPVLT